MVRHAPHAAAAQRNVFRPFVAWPLVIESYCLMARLWREAATLLIATKLANVGGEAKNLSNSLRVAGLNSINDQDYKLLMLKRSKSMGAWPNAYVYPGGMVEKADFSAKWWEVFKKRGPEGLSEVNMLVGRIPAPRPSVLQANSYDWILEPLPNRLPPELALRLTAIRETFEECGILFARPNIANLDEPTKTHRVDNAKDWQERVQKDAGEFMKLCLELDCCPDVWALHEWCNWLTPTFMKPRFESIFFLCALNERPAVSYSRTEISNHLWCSPTQFLTMVKQKEILFPPPQLYETSRLLNFSELDLLEKFAKKRSSNTLTTMLPVQVVAQDGFVFLFPGDDLYPEKPDLAGSGQPKAAVEETLEELASNAHYVNRVYFDSGLNMRLVCNVELRDGHKKPIFSDGALPWTNPRL